MITLIWAQDENRLIGNKGTLPWHLPNDLKFFKEKTLHQTIVMGRKTFEGMNCRLLPNRQTVILTRDTTYRVDGAIVCHTIDDVLEMAKTTAIYIVGGSEIYALFLPYANYLIQTKIKATFDGDAYMQSIPLEQFEIVERLDGIVDDKNHYAHEFITYRKRANY